MNYECLLCGALTVPIGREAALVAVADLRDQLAEARRDRDRLEIRQQELLATIRRLSVEVPYPEEARNAATLIAEVGTLRARLAEAARERRDATQRAEAAERDLEMLATPRALMTQRIAKDERERIARWLEEGDSHARPHEKLALAAAIRAGQHKEPKEP